MGPLREAFDIVVGRIRILLLRPEGNDISPTDQSLGARLSASPDILVEEQPFDPDDVADMQRKLAGWTGKAAGVIGAMNVPQSTRLGELAEQMNLLCFVANNNPSVWQHRRHIFHIGMPSNQTADAVATALADKTQLRRVLLLHDHTEFQQRVAANMETALRARGKDVRSQAHDPLAAFETPNGWNPDVIYVVFSSERKALPIVRAIRDTASGMPIILGRSLLRESFLHDIEGKSGELWFVDTNFRLEASQSEHQRRFMRVMKANGAAIPTTNHAFGWDGMTFCALALKTTQGNQLDAIDYLESGVTLEGASGSCSFSPENHNGRLGFGPTILTRWVDRRFEKV